MNTWIAWLEKQGEHAKFCDSIQVGDKVTRNQDGVLVNLSQLNRVAKKDEKQGKQKSVIEMKTPEESLGVDSDTYNKIVDECIYGEQKPTDLRTWEYIVDAVLTEENGIGNYLDRPDTEKIAKKLQERFGNVEQKPVDNKMPCNPDKCIYVQKYREKQKPADKVIEEEKPLLEKFKQAVYDCAWEKVTCKKEGETKEEYANRWAEQFLLIVRDWADDYIDFTIQQKLRNSYDKGKIDIIEKQGEKNSAWSEEDKNMLYGVIETEQYMLDVVNGVKTFDVGNKQIESQCTKELAWLKIKLLNYESKRSTREDLYPST